MSDFDQSKTYPYESSKGRLQSYAKYNALLYGDHYTAFGIEADVDFTERYNRLRYIVSNFCGLVAKVSADMTVGEGFEVSSDTNQDFVDTFIKQNNLFSEVYEAVLSGSALGDLVFKIRIENDEIILELVNPSIYFPHTDKMSRRSKPDVHELAWVETHMNGNEEKNFLVRELHSIGFIKTEVYPLVGDIKSDSYTIQKDKKMDIKSYNESYGTSYVEEFETGIDETTIIYVPNTRLRGDKKYLGESDFVGTESLQFALNNRITIVDNILDKHQDPILAVPDGVRDENGNVRKDWLDVVQLGDNGEKPEYITWNANLESAFEQIDKILEMLFMTTETSPDVIGVGKGAAESGRALKIRLIRTIAKSKRKQMYLALGLEKMFRVAMKLSKQNGFSVKGQKVEGEVDDVSIKFKDGVINDDIEMTEMQVKRVNTGIQSTADALKTLDNLTDEQAQQKAREIREQNATVDFPADV